MLKKYLLTAFLSLAMLPAPAFAEPGVDRQVENAEVVNDLPDGQAKAYIDEAPSQEVDYVEESAIAQKMTQQDKADNAAKNDPAGGAITIIAMCIVISALVVLSVLFMGFGKISSMILAKQKRKTVESNAKLKASNAHDNDDLASGEVIAAIAAAISQHFDGSHDMEDTILTIRRLRKAYSPWNSKIYNLRELPDLHRTNHPHNAI